MSNSRVYEGRLIHESSYPQRSSRYEEIEIDGIKVDYYDARNKVIHEIKKSSKMEGAHEWQLKYYLDFDTSKIKNKASHRCNGDLRPF